MDDTTNKGVQKFHGGCPHDCPDTCSMVYEVEDGQLKGVKGNKDRQSEEVVGHHGKGDLVYERWRRRSYECMCIVHMAETKV